MDRTKAAKVLTSMAGGILGLWLAIGGLELRILGTYLTWHQQIALIAYPEYLFRIESLRFNGLAGLAWPMVVFGSSWGGALFGFWIGERWSVPAMLLLSVLALAFPFAGTALGLLVLILLVYTPEIRKPSLNRSDGS